ncbi:putative hydrolases or acyltransferases {alpha/beta hydrolase superfamily} [Geoglobus ahangari]|uniref:Putative hydrolases or acyltransferases (alpha/beta hydrolase superfamily) n=1 Tax=Geoglobus ahangari TaxID=113653 RepID=A0A0F7IG13_9EURY|nr:alpha/beta hydrolase [Geoglobus ahangari]AKG91474.1 putative hydrolases or acyltransferases {alpha/beta hydrolase superfamily} [Geoglobus ahangari]NOY11446.1 alpha/beta hydrolase [Archaeoglobi archaeon]
MHVNVGGVEVYVEGEGEILFIHGAGMSSEVWERQLSALNAMAVDLPNHGRSGKMSVESVGDYAEVLIDLVDELGINPVIAGHSMGGAIAQEYVLKGGKARGLILIGTGPKLPVNPKLLQGLEENFEGMVEKLTKWLFAKDFEGKKAREKARQMMLSAGKELLIQDFRLCDAFNIEDKYRKGEVRIDVPTLIVCGNADVMTPLEYSEFLREHIPGSKLAIIHNAGHMVMVEKPAEFNKIVKEFSDGIE